MGIIKAFSGALGGTFADQWKEIVTCGAFDEQTALTRGVLKRTDNGRGSNLQNSEAVLTNGSKIFVPENTAAIVFSQGGIEAIITKPGGYVYENGQESVFDGESLFAPIANQIINRLQYGGETSDYKTVSFINLREIRNIKFGTRGPMLYNDAFYGTDLEITAYGTISLLITDPVTFARNFVPPNATSYSFSSKEAREQIMGEFLQSFLVAVNSLSEEYRISQLPAKANELTEALYADDNNAGSWEKRFGFRLVKVGIQDIDFSPDSKELVKQYSANKMNLKAYDDITQKASNIGAQQKIAQGIQDNGLGEGGAGMVFGINLAQGMNANAGAVGTMSFEEQVANVSKLKELLDEGILTQEEFNQKKKEIMGL